MGSNDMMLLAAPFLVVLAAAAYLRIRWLDGRAAAAADGAVDIDQMIAENRALVEAMAVGAASASARMQDALRDTSKLARLHAAAEEVADAIESAGMTRR